MCLRRCSPPEQYYTNEIESKCNKLKQGLGHKAGVCWAYQGACVRATKGSGMSSSNQCMESITLFYQCIQQVGIYLSEGFRMSQQQCKKNQFMKANLCPFSCGSVEVGSSWSNPLSNLDLQGEIICWGQVCHGSCPALWWWSWVALDSSHAH